MEIVYAEALPWDDTWGSHVLVNWDPVRNLFGGICPLWVPKLPYPSPCLAPKAQVMKNIHVWPPPCLLQPPAALTGSWTCFSCFSQHCTYGGPLTWCVIKWLRGLVKYNSGHIVLMKHYKTILVSASFSVLINSRFTSLSAKMEKIESS